MDNRYYLINKNKIDLMKEKWDFLVILDACRYDIFNNIFREFFSNGDFYKAVSPATSTGEWFKKVFQKKYYENIVYINANPKVYIHSIKQGYTKNKNQFFKFYNIWKHSWNHNIGTVHPKEVNSSFNKFYLKYPKKRFILHYLQPHAPYIINHGAEMNLTNDMTKWIKNKKLERNISRFVRVVTFWRIGYIWKFLKFFNISSHKPIGKAWFINGDELLKKNYEHELIRVLKYVQILVENIEGDWIITADHGERLGEHFKYSHGGPRDKEVVEVPWLRIKK